MVKIYLDETGTAHVYPYAVQQGNKVIPAEAREEAETLAEETGGEIIPLEQPTAAQMETIAARSGFTKVDEAQAFVENVMAGDSGLTVQQQLMLTQLKQQQMIDALIAAQAGGGENV